jgi:uncharacterized protein with HEPN domain
MSRIQYQMRWPFHLEQIIQAIEKIEAYSTGMTRVDFLADERTIDAVIRNLEIIGEAIHHIPNKIRMHHQNIPWINLRHMRNFLTHEYFSVDPNIIWETITKDLQGLKTSFKHMLKDIHPE